MRRSSPAKRIATVQALIQREAVGARAASGKRAYHTRSRRIVIAQRLSRGIRDDSIYLRIDELGSIDAARYAGTIETIRATPASANTAPPSVTASSEPIPKSAVRNTRATAAMNARPMATPATN